MNLPVLLIGALQPEVYAFFVLVVVILLVLYRVYVAEIAAEVVHVFRTRQKILNRISPLSLASDLSHKVRTFLKTFDCAEISGTFSKSEISTILYELLDIRQTLGNSLEMYPDSLTDGVKNLASMIDQFKNRAAQGRKGGGVMSDRDLVEDIRQIRDFMQQSLSGPLERYCCGRKVQ